MESPIRWYVLKAGMQRQAIVGIILLVMAQTACSTVKSDYEAAKASNSVEKYSQFLIDHKDSVYEDEVKGLRENALVSLIKQKVRENETDSVYALSRIIDSYFAEYPIGRHANEINRFRDETWFRKAQQAASPDAYQAYVIEYPQGIFIKEAREAREKLVYQEAIASNDPDKLDAYLTEYPRGIFVSDIKTVREKVWFERAKNQNRQSGYETFLLEYPTGVYSQSAKELFEQLLYQQALEQKSPELLQTYLFKFPNGRFAAEISAAQETILFEQVTKEHSVQSYDLFMAKYPKSDYLLEITRLREEALFSDAKLRKSLTTYYRYLTEYPQGQHATEARDFISDSKSLEELNAELPEIEKAWDLTLALDSYFQYEWFISQFPDSQYSQKAKELLRKRREALGYLKN